MSTPKTMKAVVFDGPFKVSVQDRPVPQLQSPQDALIKVETTALCGSELHTYRGIDKSPIGFIMGHEFVGTVISVGEEVKDIKVGDKVVAPFTSSCGTCFYCTHSFSSRCTSSLLFGSPRLDGGQAEYVRVPHADGTLMKAPEGIDQRVLVLTADIFPTGYFGVKNAYNLLLPQKAEEATVVVVGCGPVGLCAVIAAVEKAGGRGRVFAVDGVESRLELAKKLGAEPLNFKGLGKEGMLERVRAVTEGRGADAVVEVVGLSSALRTAFDLVRPFGVISSIGVHNAEIPWNGDEAYSKNIRLQMGRCPVRSIAPEALEVLKRNQHKLDFMFDKIMPLGEAVDGYDLFDKMKVQKVIFTP